VDWKTLKTSYEKIGKTYSDKVLSGYIDFFSTVLNGVKDKRNLQYRINRLRLMVYTKLLKGKNSAFQK